jgi:hypothetical protein
MNTTHWPLVFVDWDSVQTDEELERYFAESRANLERRQLFAMVTHIRRFDQSRRHRNAIAGFMKETDAAAKEYCIGTAMVCESPAFRFGLSTVLLIKGFAVPYRICGTFDQAMAFCRERAHERELALPERLDWISMTRQQTDVGKR